MDRPGIGIDNGTIYTRIIRVGYAKMRKPLETGDGDKINLTRFGNF